MQSVNTVFLPSGSSILGTGALYGIVAEQPWSTGKKPVRVYDIAVNGNKLSEALVLRTGPSTNSNSYLTVIIETSTVLASGYTDRIFSEGLIFPNGLYVSTGTGFVSALITYLIEV